MIWGEMDFAYALSLIDLDMMSDLVHLALRSGYGHTIGRSMTCLDRLDRPDLRLLVQLRLRWCFDGTNMSRDGSRSSKV